MSIVSIELLATINLHYYAYYSESEELDQSLFCLCQEPIPNISPNFGQALRSFTLSRRGTPVPQIIYAPSHGGLLGV